MGWGRTWTIDATPLPIVTDVRLVHDENACCGRAEAGRGRGARARGEGSAQRTARRGAHRTRQRGARGDARPTHLVNPRHAVGDRHGREVRAPIEHPLRARGGGARSGRAREACAWRSGRRDAARIARGRGEPGATRGRRTRPIDVTPSPIVTDVRLEHPSNASCGRADRSAVGAHARGEGSAQRTGRLGAHRTRRASPATRIARGRGEPGRRAADARSQSTSRCRGSSRT